MTPPSERKADQGGFSSKIEDAVTGAAAFIARYARTLALAAQPREIGRRLLDTGPGALLEPHTYLAVSAFASIAVLRVTGSGHGEVLIAQLQAELKDISIASLTIGTIPVVLSLVLWTRLAAFVLSIVGQPESETNVAALLAYIGGTQLGLFAVARLMLAALGGISRDLDFVLVMAPLFALWGYPFLYALLAGRNVLPTSRKKFILPAIVGIVFIYANPVVVYLVAMAPQYVAEKQLEAERSLAFTVPLEAMLTTTAVSDHRVQYVFWLRNNTKNTYILHRKAQLVFDWQRSGDRVGLTVDRWSAGNEPILTVRPGELAWMEVTTDRELRRLSGLEERSVFNTVVKADCVIASGGLRHGELATTEQCINTRGDGTVTPCQRVLK